MGHCGGEELDAGAGGRLKQFQQGASAELSAAAWPWVRCVWAGSLSVQIGMWISSCVAVKNKTKYLSPLFPHTQFGDVALLARGLMWNCNHYDITPGITWLSVDAHSALKRSTFFLTMCGVYTECRCQWRPEAWCPGARVTGVGAGIRTCDLWKSSTHS